MSVQSSTAPPGVLHIAAFLAFFPYLRLFENRLDIQPYFFVLACCYILLLRRSLPKLGRFVYFLVPAAVSIAYLLAFVDIFHARMAANYATPVVSGIVFADIISRVGTKRLATWASIAQCIYVGYGVLQKMGFGMLDFLAASRGSGDLRGVASLTNEPNFFGVMSFWLFAIAFRFGTRRQAVTSTFMLLVVNLWLVSSPISQFCLIFALLVWMPELKRVGGLVALSALAVAGVIFVEVAPPDLLGSIAGARPSRLYQAVASLDVASFFQDASASSRGASLTMAFLGSLDNAFLPTAPRSFFDFYDVTIDSWRHIFWFGHATHRPFSGFGTYIYDYGIFGAALSVVLIRSIFRTFVDWRLAAGLTLSLLIAVPISFPLAGLSVGFAVACRMGVHDGEDSDSVSLGDRVRLSHT